MALSWTLDKLGPMARTADDCGLVLAAIAGHDDLDATSIVEGFEYRERARPGARLRLMVPKGVGEEVQPAVRDNFEASIRALGAVADVTRGVEWPDLPWGPSVSAIVGAEGAAAFIDLIEAGRVKELKCPRCRHGGYAS